MRIIDNKESFELVFKEYYPQLILYAKSMVKSSELAEDIVQDFFTTLWNKKGKISIHSKIRSFMFQSIHNSCLNHISRKKINTEEVKEDMLHDIPHEELIEIIERNTLINKAVNQLPEQRRRIFKLACYEGLKHKEIAETLDISPNTVKTQMARALSNLRENLGDIFLYYLLFSKNK